jgi:phage gpG-like protein
MALSPAQSIGRGLRIDDMITQFIFQPSMGISAAQIDKLGIDIRSFREPLKRAIQQVMAPSFRKNFDVGGRPDAWEPLSDATISMRESMDRTGSDTPLNLTGLLKKTIQQLNIWTITTTTATIRDLPDKIWYGKVHQAGSEGSGGSISMKSRLKQAGGDAKAAMHSLDDDIIAAMREGKKVAPKGGAKAIPARPFVVVQEDDWDAIEEVFVKWLEERAVRSGFVTAGGA